MISTREKKQYETHTIVLTDKSNPLTWTNESIPDITRTDVIVGYHFQRKQPMAISQERPLVVSLHTLPINEAEDSTVHDVEELRIIFIEWLNMLETDKNPVLFKNPPLDSWLLSKNNWIKKMVTRYRLKYNRPYDDTLSDIYYVIVKLYNQKTIYMNNLNYVEKAIECEILGQFNYNRNRLYGNNVSSLDSLLYTSDDDNALSLNDILPAKKSEDIDYELEEKMNYILDDLAEDFSPREIEQITKNRVFLSNAIYRRLLTWRKSHKRKDYNL